MAFVTLAEAKAQLSIHPTNTAHDDRLARLILAAVAWAENFLNIEDLDELVDESPVVSPQDVPEDVKSALLMHVEAEFDRDPKTMELLLKRAETMLWPYREGLEI